MAADDDPALRELRAAWRSLPDEEPPERGLAELMAAARVRAEEMAAARTPWWKRAAAALMRPPVLALASVLVLLGGLFAVTSSHKGVSPEPTPSEAPSAPATPSAATGSATFPTSRAQEPFGGTPDPHAPLVGDFEGLPKRPAKAESTRELPKKAPVHHSADQAPPVAHEKPSPPASPPPYEQAPAAAPPPEPTVPAPAPATTPAGGGGAVGDDDGEADDGQTRGPVQKKKAKGEANPLDSDLAACRAAAARGDCAAAQTCANKIRARDAAYYANRVAGDAAIAGCLK